MGSQKDRQYSHSTQDYSFVRYRPVFSEDNELRSTLLSGGFQDVVTQSDLDIDIGQVTYLVKSIGMEILNRPFT